MQKVGLVLGCNGQDGSYLCELLLEKDYQVIGLYRRSSFPNFNRIEHIKDRLVLVEGDVTDYSSLSSLIERYKPNEIYNLAAQSHVKSSFDQPFYTTNVDYIGCLNLLEILKHMYHHGHFIKLYQASTSEMFGSCYKETVFTMGDINKEGEFIKNGDYRLVKYQDEDTPMKPNSPYAIAKLAAHNAIRLYREAYGIFCCSGILFNHESERRGEEFVTKKITKYLGNLIKTRAWKENGFTYIDYTKGPLEKLKLGNLDSSRDWGYAKDYIEGMWLMLQQDKPDDFILATGETHTVKEFLHEAFMMMGLNWQDYVEIDPQFNRPCEVPYLCGNANKAKSVLGWKPKTKFKELVRIMSRID